MAGLPKTLGMIPGGGTRRTFGTAHWTGLEWLANIGGNLVPCRWLDPIQPVQGGKIVIDITDDGYGQSAALVIGGYTDQPRPSTGTILAVGAAELVFSGEDGGTYATTRYIGTYAPGDPVYLSWAAGRATVIGVIPAIAQPKPAPPPPPAPVAFAGVTPAVVTVSDTWAVGGWGRWATSRYGGEDVYSGTWAGTTTTGAWFYGVPSPEIVGKNILRIRFKLPRRLAVGSNNAAASVHLYAHDSQSRPAGDVSRVAGPFDYNVPAGWAGDYIDLPLSFAPALQGGGGISIAGNPYVGFVSRLDDPEAGKLLIDWAQ